MSTGVDEGECSIPFDDSLLNLLNHDQLQYLALQHDPMKRTDYHGFDLYLALKEEVEQMIMI